MTICPITYDTIDHDEIYSQRGLKLLSPQLKTLQPIPFTKSELHQEAHKHAGKMSIQGVQEKLSAILSPKQQIFKIVDSHGKYILKPPHIHYPDTPENEDLSMRLATLVGIDVPLHGLVYNRDQSRTYFIKRFDRSGQKSKISTEDFAQLSGHTRHGKYSSSMEKIIELVDEFATFPMIEKLKLFRRTLFNFLIGNEDMHLKNFSLIQRNKKSELAPAYDFLNTTLYTGDKEELALPLNGKKSNLKRKDLVDYFGSNRLKLKPRVIEEELKQIEQKIPAMKALIDISFLSAPIREQYIELFDKRVHRLYATTD